MPQVVHDLDATLERLAVAMVLVWPEPIERNFEREENIRGCDDCVGQRVPGKVLRKLGRAMDSHRFDQGFRWIGCGTMDELDGDLSCAGVDRNLIESANAQ